jgi:ABC-2 type transport system ATP-binding protein
MGLTKVYGRRKARGSKPTPKPALDTVDLDVPQGALFALLGPNGAGKSTLINILAGLVVKTAGSVRVWDIDIDTDPRGARAAIGVVPQELNIDSYFTPREYMEMQAGLYGVPVRERRTMEILDMVGLTDKADSYGRTLSGGMRRRLLIAKAMVHDPPILVLDEPTAGVDIALREQLWDNVRALNQRGVTILLTTHYLEEAENLCDRIAIINHGRVVACDSRDALLSRLDSKTMDVTVSGAIGEIPDPLRRYQTNSPAPNRLRIHYQSGRTDAGEILDAIVRSGLNVVDLRTEEADLAAIFRQLTRDDGGTARRPDEDEYR